MKKVLVNKKRYVDSVSLMSVAARVSELLGIENIEIGMATVINRNFLEGLGYQLSADITPDDLVVCVTGKDEAECDEAIKVAMDILNRKNIENVASFVSLDDPQLKAETYDLCQISYQVNMFLIKP